MRQLILPGDRSRDASFLPQGNLLKYLGRVLRMKPGDSFPALDEAGNLFDCVVRAGPGKGIELELTLKDAASVLAADAAVDAGGLPFRLALVQGLPKGQKMDLIVRQAAEAGVRVIFPVETEHCVAREEGGDLSAKLERRRKIVREALQQSGSRVRTEVMPTIRLGGLPEALSAAGFDPAASLLLFCHERPLDKTGLHAYCAGGASSVVIAVGPEGGFSAAETTLLGDMGFKPLHFEGAVLRTETAALYAIAAVKTLLAERSEWKLSK